MNVTESLPCAQVLPYSFAIPDTEIYLKAWKISIQWHAFRMLPV